MSRRLLTFFTVLLLAVPTVVNGQELMPDEPVFFLTEEQINAEFTIPSTANRTISNLEVDVQEDGVHISFAMTAISDGTSNTLIVSATLIELVPVRVSQLELENTLVSSYSVPRSLEREITNLIGRSWRRYLRSIATTEVFELNTFSLGENGISFFGD
jgi:hypothetical protein